MKSLLKRVNTLHLEMETVSKEMEKKVSAKEAPALGPYGYKEGDVMKNIPGTLASLGNFF